MKYRGLCNIVMIDDNICNIVMIDDNITESPVFQNSNVDKIYKDKNFHYS